MNEITLIPNKIYWIETNGTGNKYLPILYNKNSLWELEIYDSMREVSTNILKTIFSENCINREIDLDIDTIKVIEEDKDVFLKPFIKVEENSLFIILKNDIIAYSKGMILVPSIGAFKDAIPIQYNPFS